MPRPGPRPYECIRRAWHSDTHHILRATLIQEIFRVTNEIHCPKTRRKKEWQEKLPMVVLRAEEILYSKSNSEAEYMDLKTLSARLNDAVNTMIRRDESTERGKFLEPCVEAALSLGCLPRKATRAQRHNLGCVRLSMSPLIPSMGRPSHYEGPSFVQSQTKDSSLWNNGDYCTVVGPTCHFGDSQQYNFISPPSTSASPNPLVIAPRGPSFPPQSHNDSPLFYSSPCHRSGKALLSSTRQTVPMGCCASNTQQTWTNNVQGGQMQILHPTTRTEKGLSCVPICSISTSKAILNSWGSLISSRTDAFDVSSISSSSTSAPCDTPFAHTYLDLQAQGPIITSQMRSLPQTDLAQDATRVLCLDKCKSKIFSPSIKGKHHARAFMEEISSESNLTAYDLQLRLGPPGNCFRDVDGGFNTRPSNAN